MTGLTASALKARAGTGLHRINTNSMPKRLLLDMRPQPGAERVSEFIPLLEMIHEHS